MNKEVRQDVVTDWCTVVRCGAPTAVSDCDQSCRDRVSLLTPSTEKVSSVLRKILECEQAEPTRFSALIVLPIAAAHS